MRSNEIVCLIPSATNQICTIGAVKLQSICPAQRNHNAANTLAMIHLFHQFSYFNIYLFVRYVKICWKTHGNYEEEKTLEAL